jgi:hypothetical protein
MSELLKGKVLKILSPYKIAINLGAANGVKKGMKFVIYEEGEMIKDPSTQQDLEKLEIVKGYVEVTHVQEKISIAESYETEKRVYHPFGSMWLTSGSQEITVTEKKELTSEKITEPKPSPVKEGDFVRQIE